MRKVFFVLLLLLTPYRLPAMVWGQEVSLDSTSQESLSIILDYRFDDGYFSHNPERKATLEYAAQQWERLLLDYREVPAGTEMSFRTNFGDAEPSVLVTDSTIRGYLIFVQAVDFTALEPMQGRVSLASRRARGGQLLGSPNCGFVTFNTNPGRTWFFDSSPEYVEDIPVANHFDFLTVALHEIGHALGFIRANQAPFLERLLEGEEVFTGARAMSINAGNPIPMEPGTGHIASDWYAGPGMENAPIQRYVMQSKDPLQGYRKSISALELAMMEDMGWKVNYDALAPNPYHRPPDPRRDSLAEFFGIEEGEAGPHGLWVFDRVSEYSEAIVGPPLRYMPAYGATGLLSDLVTPDGIAVGADSWLYCAPGMNKFREGSIGQYTLLFDIKIPSYGSHYPLYNTNIYNLDGAEFVIDPRGRLGSGVGSFEGSDVVPEGEWVRVGIVIDALHYTRAFYINGKESHRLYDAGPESRWGIFSAANEKPLFCLFADGLGYDASIDVKRVFLYARVLSDLEMRRLGNADGVDFGW